MIPIGVKLATHRIAEVRFSFSSGMGEATMHVGACVQEIVESDAADDGDEQDPPRDVPHPPERRDVGGVAKVLRGKRPGNPGSNRRTKGPG
jgi:hypothetical protein